MRVAGIMSGTSLDGIDVAVVDVAGKRVTTVAHSTTPYPAVTRQRILAVSNTQCTTGQISRLNFELGELYAKAVLKLNIPGIQLIGCHGQTIFHEGSNTLQIGEAAVIAERLNIPVISDFRTRDIASGGQGAPLVPFVDYLLFRHKRLNRVALNIGGIANITILPANAMPEQVIAFDTGPGNMIVDQLVERFTRGRQRFDRNGAIASRGRIDRHMLSSWLYNPYYKTKPPKTTGREQYGTEFTDNLTVSPDMIATATALTAATIAIGVERFAPATQELIAAGGGVHNSQLMAQLAAYLPNLRITTTEEFGIDPDAKEAIAFAILAHQTWRGLPGNLPSATGAKKAVILGKLTAVK